MFFKTVCDFGVAPCLFYHSVKLADIEMFLDSYEAQASSGSTAEPSDLPFKRYRWVQLVKILLLYRAAENQQQGFSFQQRAPITVLN